MTYHWPPEILPVFSCPEMRRSRELPVPTLAGNVNVSFTVIPQLKRRGVIPGRVSSGKGLL
jgi:hypothetical protein